MKALHSGRRARLAVEVLEDRLAPATFTVTTNADAGAGSLRDAILRANAHPGADAITFNVGGGGPQSIFVQSALPALTDVVSLNATTQPGFTSSPLIQLYGAGAGPGVNGLRLLASGSSVRGLEISGFKGSAVVIGGGHCSLVGCFLGTNLAGNFALPNGLDGVTILPGAGGNHIGGPGPINRNLISGNGRYGVFIQGSVGNIVEGNRIGTDAGGMKALANYGGVAVAGAASGNLIGGTAAPAGNLISGNSTAGVLIAGSTARNNLVQGNIIGSNAAGTSAVPNSNGVFIVAGAHNNLVGGALAGQGNLISGNNREGVDLDGTGTAGNLIEGNTIGTNAAGTVALGNGGDGVFLGNGARSNTVGGNLISSNDTGLDMDGSGTSGNVVRGNKIGTNAAGTAALGNNVCGVFLRDGASNNVIGGTTAPARNVISGSSGGSATGIILDGQGTDGNVVAGNFIGTNAAGTVSLGNDIGIDIIYASDTIIGGTSAGARNIISGNVSEGVVIEGIVTTTGTIVQGNYIGLDATGTSALGNGGDGIQIDNGGSDTTIGGTTAGAGNVISGNAGAGVVIGYTDGAHCKVQGNFIGTNAAGSGAVGNGLHGVVIYNGAHDNQIGGTAAGAGNTIAFNKGAGVLIGSDAGHGFTDDAGTGNAVLGNHIFSNAGLGIDLGAFDGVTFNDLDDADSGPNNLQNFPVLEQAVSLDSAGTYIQGSLECIAALSDQSYRIEFFADTAPDASGHGEGRVFLGATTLVVPSRNNGVDFAILLPAVLPPGSVVTATATDPAGNTSEFALNITVA
jgi:titin